MLQNKFNDCYFITYFSLYLLIIALVPLSLLLLELFGARGHVWKFDYNVTFGPKFVYMGIGRHPRLSLKFDWTSIGTVPGQGLVPLPFPQVWTWSEVDVLVTPIFTLEWIASLNEWSWMTILFCVLWYLFVWISLRGFDCLGHALVSFAITPLSCAHRLWS